MGAVCPNFCQALDVEFTECEIEFSGMGANELRTFSAKVRGWQLEVGTGTTCRAGRVRTEHMVSIHACYIVYLYIHL